MSVVSGMRVCCVSLAVAMVAGCGSAEPVDVTASVATSMTAGGSASTPTSLPSEGSSVSDARSGRGAAPRISLPVEPGSTVEGLVDVDGHDLYVRCAGNGSPTVVYFTGWENGIAIDIATGIESALGPEFRVCSYERRNVRPSETVEGTQSPEDVIADIDGLLAALGEHGPFLLLGASFGGLVASAYAVAHPDRVAGMVLLDSSTGVDYDLDEQQDFSGPCAESNRHADAWNSLEKLDNCSLAAWIHDRRDSEPDAPLLFLAAQDSSSRDLGVAGDVTRQAWVESWEPGMWRVVDVPHPMDRDNPGLVADAVTEVIDLVHG
jgi:alpha/beta hydrolase fold